jgi:hypothetical protein
VAPCVADAPMSRTAPKLRLGRSVSGQRSACTKVTLRHVEGFLPELLKSLLVVAGSCALSSFTRAPRRA